MLRSSRIQLLPTFSKLSNEKICLCIESVPDEQKHELMRGGSRYSDVTHEISQFSFNDSFGLNFV